MISKKSRKWWTLTAMCLLTVMLNVDATAVSLTIPVVSEEFHASLASMQWVLNAYTLFSAMFLILGSKLGDTYGHKKIFLIGTSLFVLGSVAAGLSTNEYSLIAFRALQGFALGVSYPMTIVLTFAIFPKKEQGFALSFVVATMGISLAMGPPIGGWIVETIGWRWVYFVNVPIGILTFVLAYIFCPPHKKEDSPPIDYLGALFLSLGLLGVLLALNEVQNWGLHSVLFWTILSLGFLCFGILYWIDRKKPFAILPFSLFTHRNLVLNNLIRLLIQALFVSPIFFFPLYLINIAGYTPIESGYLLLFLTVVIGIYSPFAGKWVDRVGDKIPNILSMALFALAYLFLYFLGSQPNLFLLGVGLILIGIGTSITFVTTVTGSVSEVPKSDEGIATSVVLTTAWFGCGFGVAIMGSVLSFASERYLDQHIQQFIDTPSQSQLEMLNRVAKGVLPYSGLEEVFSSEALTQAIEIGRKAFVHGFHITSLMWIAASLLGLLVAFGLKSHPRSNS